MAAPEQVSDTTVGENQLGIAADKTRRTICIQNESDTDMVCSFLSEEPAEDGGWLLGAGTSRTMRFADWPQIVNALVLYCAATGKAFNIHTDRN